ncbi:hypothetical protein BSL78_19228 [Apostichopus japonicus]|uniref:Alkylated DNA repair protein AlkB homologue 8 N-terminal domain-containing protein n=1 Tax=Stichopus japonicus TaxID=307972 RepID=A0A2G8K7B0_STIJA|nr:hypothetical protein BSL78_19228 [Apostichopus japonicus]
MAGLIRGNDDGAYLCQLQSFVDYCDSNFLQLNISKTKEMIIDFRRNAVEPPPVMIKGKEVERVHSYKYLGIHLNNSLTWDGHVDALVKKLNTRLYCLRKLSKFNVRTDIMQMFYNSIICGVWRYCLICWGGNVTKVEKDRIDHIIRKAGGVIGGQQHTVDSVYQSLLQTKLDSVWNDCCHPLHCYLNDNVINRGSGRLRQPYTRTNRYRNSFTPRAIKLFNVNLPIKYAKDKVPLLREKMSLLKGMGEHSRELIVKKMLLKYLPEDRGDEYLELAREMTKHAHDNGDDNSAVQILEKAIKKHRDLVSYEDINMMAELLMAKKDYQKTLWFLTSSCSMTLQQEDGEIAGVKEELDVSRVTSLSVPSELPIDLKVILSVCLIHLDAKQIVIQQNLEPLFEESPEMMGDLYLDVAEAYLDKGNNEAARPILALLVNSKNYNLTLLSNYRAASRTDQDALDLLSFDVEDGASSIPQDIQLVYRKCLLLHNTEHHEEFSHLALLLLKQYYCKGQADKSSEEDDEETQTFSGDISMITQTDWYNLLLKACQALKLLQRYQDMVDITQSAVNNEKLRDFHDRKELVNLEFLLVLSQFFNGEYRACYSVLRNMTKKYADNNRFMNFFSLVTNLSNERKHYRYCLRMTIKIFPDNFAFCYLNGCNAMVRGSYKHALGEFVIALRQNVEAPYPNFCIGLCFFHLANQKFIDKRHSVILQGFAFMKRYEEYRGACQETYYNIGRALHGVEVKGQQRSKCKNLVSVITPIEGLDVLDTWYMNPPYRLEDSCHILWRSKVIGGQQRWLCEHLPNTITP